MESSSGITMIELAIVLAVIAILATLATPAFLDVKHGYNVNIAVRNASTDIQLTKVRAISRNRKHRLRFRYPSADEYSIQEDTANLNSWDAEDVDLIVKTVQLPQDIVFGLLGGVAGPDGAAVDSDGVRFDGDNDTVFDNKGAAEEGTVYLIPSKDKVSGRANRMRAVRIRFKTTAQVKAYKYNGSSWVDF